MSELEVPTASHEAASKMRRDCVDYEDLQAIAAPIVVAELRRLAGLLDVPSKLCAVNAEEEAYFNGKRKAATMLRRNADRIEAGA